MKPEYIIIHHSLTKDSQTVSWNAIRRYHVHKLGWDYIGYHFGVELVGDHYEVLLGRWPNMFGAHCSQEKMNFNSWGICVVGNFDVAEPEASQLIVLKHLARSLMEIGGIDRDHIKRHKDFAQYKSCPGGMFPFEQFVRSV